MSLAAALGSMTMKNMIPPDLEPNRKKYNAMEPVFQEIQKSIQIPDYEKKEHNVIVKEVLDIIVTELKAVDPLFKHIFSKILYGGSYYDGLKLKSPDEYDIDLALKLLPKELNPRLEVCDTAGFVKVRVDLDKLKQKPNYGEYKSMEKFIDGYNYLLTEKFRDWFEGILIKANNSLERKQPKYKFTFKKSGPAFTLNLYIDNKLVCIDLVPSIIFDQEKWPGPPFRKNVTMKREFLVVPKSPVNASRHNTAWRLSFQEQERELINGKQRLKDTIRLLKLLRNIQVQENSIPSYYIKTVMMLMVETVDENFWSSNSASYIFMMGLKYFAKLLERKELPYYWNENYNLMKYKKAITLENWSRRMNRIFKTLESKLDSPSLRSELLDTFGVKQSTNRESDRILENGLNLLLNNGTNQTILRDTEERKNIETVEEVDFDDSGISSIECGDEVTLVTALEESNRIEDIPSEKKLCDSIQSSIQDVKDDHVRGRQLCLWRDSTEYEAFGVCVMKKLEKMDPTQAVYAQKLIIDILGRGLLNQLGNSTENDTSRILPIAHCMSESKSDFEVI